jgi:hypothetical protein
VVVVVVKVVVVPERILHGLLFYSGPLKSLLSFR